MFFKALTEISQKAGSALTLSHLSKTRYDGEVGNEHFDGKSTKQMASALNNGRQSGVTNKGDRS